MATPMPRIVAEISKNWIGPVQVPATENLLSHQFERVIEVNASRGYALESWQLQRIAAPLADGRPAYLNETIIAVFVATEPHPYPMPTP